LREIFSNNVSNKYSNYGLDYNRKLIEKIYNEKIQTKVIDILEMTFLECLEHLRGSKHYEQLEGLENVYEIVINELEKKENDEYMANFKEFVNRFEQYYENKRSREK
jgi:F0F1-type ATP synthase gamma subunit